MSQDLVVVESPTKAKTLSRFLGNKYRIEASMGHVRDLPKSEMGIDIEHNFEPQYIIPGDKKKRVGELKKLAKAASVIYLASDPDREGEAIAWHIAHIFKEGKSHPEFKRVVFHEITESAIKEAFDHPREIDLKLVHAQQARRVLDRLVGYKLSPLLWKKVRRGLSAGRVQSVALRLIVEREKEILIFKPVEYWDIEVLLKASSGQFAASLIELNSQKIKLDNQKITQEHLEKLRQASYSIEKITKREVKRQPLPPFTTSTLQQAGGNKLGFSAKRIMSAAQHLYERGLITYMRTDSLNLAPIALTQARDFIAKNYGKNYLPPTPRVFKTKSRNAQEAHEAIRPTNLDMSAESLKTEGLTTDQVKVYDLIWKRMVACQVKEALMDQTTVDVLASSSYRLRASGSVIKFDGWLRVYGIKEEIEEEEGKTDEKKQLLPELREGEVVNLLEITPGQHFTEPPPRFNEASLIKKLEELGIGRPSTYAPTISTIQERMYVEKKERKLFPTPLGMAVIEFLMKNFSEILDYSFTAHMEDQLDDIASGKQLWQPTIKEFYDPFEKKLEQTTEQAERVQVATETVDKKCPECGKQLLVRFGKFGKFLACSGFPECKHTEPFEEIINTPCPKDGGQVVLRKTRKGRPFYGCKNYPNCDFASWTNPDKKTDQGSVKDN